MLTLLKWVLVVAAGLTTVITISGSVRGPEGQVVTQELHDQRRVLVAVLVQGVQLGDGIIKCLNGEEKKIKIRIKIIIFLICYKTIISYINILKQQEAKLINILFTKEILNPDYIKSTTYRKSFNKRRQY
jgi:hypothetical protein